MNKKLYSRLLDHAELTGVELEDFLWELSKSQYSIDNYIVYNMDDKINVLYDCTKMRIVEVR